jgi:hypothetical protein
MDSRSVGDTRAIMICWFGQYQPSLAMLDVLISPHVLHQLVFFKEFEIQFLKKIYGMWSINEGMFGSFTLPTLYFSSITLYISPLTLLSLDQTTLAMSSSGSMWLDVEMTEDEVLNMSHQTMMDVAVKIVTPSPLPDQWY